jgi:hypothetical protein
MKMPTFFTPTPIINQGAKDGHSCAPCETKAQWAGPPQLRFSRAECDGWPAVAATSSAQYTNYDSVDGKTSLNFNYRKQTAQVVSYNEGIAEGSYSTDAWYAYLYPASGSSTLDGTKTSFAYFRIRLLGGTTLNLGKVGVTLYGGTINPTSLSTTGMTELQSAEFVTAGNLLIGFFALGSTAGASKRVTPFEGSFSYSDTTVTTGLALKVSGGVPAASVEVELGAPPNIENRMWAAYARELRNRR